MNELSTCAAFLYIMLLTELPTEVQEGINASRTAVIRLQKKQW